MSTHVKNVHEACGDNEQGNQVYNIYNANSNDGSLTAFICTKCNYLQIKRDRMIQHLIKQHKLTEAAENVDFEKVILIPNMTPIKSNGLKEYDYVKTAKRYSCTICSKQCQSANEFEDHFDEEHTQTVEYKCFCGEDMSLDGFPLNGYYILAHLDRHKADLYRCKICPGIFYDQKDISNHLLNQHEEHPFKYERIHRERNKKPTLTEVVFKQMTCSVCNITLEKPTCACAIEHFKVVHEADAVSLTGFVSTKRSSESRTEFWLGIPCAINF